MSSLGEVRRRRRPSKQGSKLSCRTTALKCQCFQINRTEHGLILIRCRGNTMTRTTSSEEPLRQCTRMPKRLFLPRERYEIIKVDNLPNKSVKYLQRLEVRLYRA